ncbi:transposase [Flavobacterium aciduliphilum]|nr:transposase [Flavobacterium aciduliphilum]
MKQRKSNRLKGYDYSKNNLYFVTNCVKNNLCCLGRVIPVGTGRDLSVHHPEIHHPEKEYIMELNQYGLIVEERIHWLMSQYGYVDIHNYIVMPNHFHIILEIDSSLLKNKISENNSERTAREQSEQKIKSLSSLIGALKTTSSKLIHQENFTDFAWHRSFHDHIIRDEKSYTNISNYIDLNPEKWFKDRFYNND